jgi:hypothetical protein
VGLALGLAVWGAAGAGAADRPGSAAPLKVSTVSFVIGHRVFTEFRDQVTVKMNEDFRVGDSDYSARVVEFQPDFTMDLKSHRIGSRSQAPNNPAVRLRVWKNGAPDDTVWAFLKMPPHFARHSMLAFRLTELTFANHAPVRAAHDSTAGDSAAEGSAARRTTAPSGGHQP